MPRNAMVGVGPRSYFAYLQPQRPYPMVCDVCNSSDELVGAVSLSVPHETNFENDG